MNIHRLPSEEKDEELKAMLSSSPMWYRWKLLILAAKIHGPVSIRDRLKPYYREAQRKKRRKKKEKRDDSYQDQ